MLKYPMKQFSEEQVSLIMEIMKGVITHDRIALLNKKRKKPVVEIHEIFDFYRTLARTEFIRELVYYFDPKDGNVNTFSLFKHNTYLGLAINPNNAHHLPDVLQLYEKRNRTLQMFLFCLNTRFLFDGRHLPEFEALVDPLSFSFKMDDLLNADITELSHLYEFLGRMQKDLMGFEKRKPGDIFPCFIRMIFDDKYVNDHSEMSLFLRYPRIRIIFMIYDARARYGVDLFSEESLKYFKSIWQWALKQMKKILKILHPSSTYDKKFFPNHSQVMEESFQRIIATYYTLLFLHSPMLHSFCSSALFFVLEELLGRKKKKKTKFIRNRGNNSKKSGFYIFESILRKMSCLICLLIEGNEGKYNKRGKIKCQRNLKRFFRLEAGYYPPNSNIGSEPDTMMASKRGALNQITYYSVQHHHSTPNYIERGYSVYPRAPEWVSSSSGKRKLEQIIKDRQDRNLPSCQDLHIMRQLRSISFPATFDFQKLRKTIDDYCIAVWCDYRLSQLLYEDGFRDHYKRNERPSVFKI